MTKRTYNVNGITNLCDAKNVLISVGPPHDIHRDIVVMRITFHPPVPKETVK